jgi:SAM-dependent methyltransferase
MPAEQRFTFDEVAELYDRHRPGYPEALFDDLIALSGISPGGRILEIGCGTGQATVPLACRGFPVLCLEPGPSLARVARQQLASFPAVEVVSQTFEAWEVEAGAFSLVVSAQAFHWVSPDVRFTKAAAALHPEGALAVLGNEGALAVLGRADVFEPSPLREALNAVYAQHAPALAGPSATRWYAEEGPIPTLFADSGCFGPVTWRRYPWSQIYMASDYLDLLRTYSDHCLLAPERRESLLDAVGRVIERHGGSIEIRYEAHLYMARRAA